jgi:transposase
MPMGHRDRDRQEDLFVCPADLPTASHPFYSRLNGLLAEAEFDAFVEAACAPYYDAGTSGGRPSIPPGVYFRMLFIGYFEGIDSQRGIAWRCNDSLALRGFLGVPLTERTPDHSSLTRIRDRLPEEVADKVFQFMLRLAHAKGLSASGTVGVDSTTLEANAAMKGIVRRDNGDDYKEFLRKLALAEGIKDPNDEDLRRFDRKRRDKKCSNDDWVSPSDGDAEITRMKDGRTHLAYKAEHVVDLASGLILAAEVLPGTMADHASMVDSVLTAQSHVDAAATLQPSASSTAQRVAAVGKGVPITAAAGDKGYHAAATLELATHLHLKTYIPEPERRGKDKRRLADHPEPQRRAAANNRRRMQRAKGKRLGERVRYLVRAVPELWPFAFEVGPDREPCERCNGRGWVER